MMRPDFFIQELIDMIDEVDLMIAVSLVLSWQNDRESYIIEA